MTSLESQSASKWSPTDYYGAELESSEQKQNLTKAFTLQRDTETDYVLLNYLNAIQRMSDHTSIRLKMQANRKHTVQKEIRILRFVFFLKQLW